MFAHVIKETDLLGTLDLSALKRIGLGSALITRSLLDRIQAVFPGATIGLGYGTTEAGPAVPSLSRRHPDPAARARLSRAGGDVRLVDGPSAHEGVLLMRNPSLMSDYHNLPQQTAKALREGWYDSGDIMRRDANGFHYFGGRAGDMFVCSGENIYPSEVETMLEKHPSVQQAAVVPLPDEERGQVPVAFVVYHASEMIEADQIRRFALANGPAYQHPRRIAFLQELLWAGTNKVDRRALIARARELESAQRWAR